MAVIQAEQLDGLIKTTLPHYERERKAEAAARLTKYVGVKNLFKKKKVGYVDGYSIEWVITTDYANTATQTGLYDTIAPSTATYNVRANMPLKHTRTHASWDLREVSMNKSPARIINYVKEKVFGMDLAEIEHLENQIWNGPAVGDDESVFGIWGGWLYSPADAGGSNSSGVFASSSTGGRVNLNPLNAPGGPAGVSRVTYPRTSHHYQNYSAITYDDLFSKMRNGFDEIDFEAPVDYAQLRDGNTKFGIYCTQPDARAAADECRLQNENIGTDLAYYDGKATIRGVQIMGVPKLNSIDAGKSTPNHPFLVIDWSQLRPFCLEGWAPYEVTEKGGGNQPVVVNKVRYWTWGIRAFICKTMALFTSD
jgi:hypothetical protein